MDNADKVTLDRMKNEIKISFAKMTLEQIEAIRTMNIHDVKPDLLHAIRQNAQAVYLNW